MSLSCDLFCRVIDNFGDAAVCWRLARQLAGEHGWDVRLWIDDVAPLARLRPGIDAQQTRQRVDAVDIRQWTSLTADAEPADIVIEAFACELPAAFVEAMSRRRPRPVWLNLEYLSAEPWVGSYHGLASPHPRLPLTKYFFFPGFVPESGGLLRERDLPSSGASTTADFRISLFGYDNPALPAVLDAWASGSEPMRIAVADGHTRRQVAAWLGKDFAIGSRQRLGAIEFEALPFLAQVEYDRLLADCRLNFVRGEDSFVRAQWAMRPFVWQIYPQAEDSHMVKLDAFLDRYGRNLPTGIRAAVVAFWHGWNGRGDAAAAWPAFRAALPTLEAHSASWAAEIAASGDLAGNLVKFCLNRI